MCCEYAMALPTRSREEEMERTKPGTAERTWDLAGGTGASGQARVICLGNGDLRNEPAQLRQDGAGEGGWWLSVPWLRGERL